VKKKQTMVHSLKRKALVNALLQIENQQSLEDDQVEEEEELKHNKNTCTRKYCIYCIPNDASDKPYIAPKSSPRKADAQEILDVELLRIQLNAATQDLEQVNKKAQDIKTKWKTQEASLKSEKKKKLKKLSRVKTSTKGLNNALCSMEPYIQQSTQALIDKHKNIANYLTKWLIEYMNARRAYRGELAAFNKEHKKPILAKVKRMKMQLAKQE
jgi:hypothetical protein